MKSLTDIVAAKHGAWKVDELAQLLACSEKVLYKFIRQGRLPAFRIGTLVRLDPKSTSVWLESKQSS